MAEQLPLALGHRPAVGRQDYLVAPCNSDAVRWIDRYPDWPNGGLVLWGEAASGKSHLVEVWRAQSGGEVIAASDLDRRDARELAMAPGVAIDGVDGEAGGKLGRGRETVMFHLYNVLREQNKCLLLTGRRPVKAWPLELADLRSRLLALPVAGIGQPDDGTLTAVLLKLLYDRQLVVGEEVLDYAVLRMERSFHAARRLVDDLDRQSLADKGRVTTALVRKILGRTVATGE